MCGVRTNEDIAKPCALRFQAIESQMESIQRELESYEDVMISIEDGTKKIRSILVGNENGQPGMAERSRELQAIQERTLDRVRQLEEWQQGRAWKMWQKLAAVLVVLLAAGSFILQVVRVVS